MFLAVVALGVAAGLVWQAASAVGPRGNALAVHADGKVELSGAR